MHIPHHNALSAGQQLSDCPIHPLACVCGPPGAGQSVRGLHKVTYVDILRKLIREGVLPRGAALFNDALNHHYSREARELMHRHGVNWGIFPGGRPCLVCCFCRLDTC